jgi:hypothetical protein
VPAFPSSALLTIAPNAPFAEMICSELKGEGIAAWFTSAVAFGGANTMVNPTAQCEVWVREEDLERARELLG